MGAKEWRGEKVMVESAPPVSPWSACFCLFLLVFCCCLHERLRRIFSNIFLGSKILAENSPARPPIIVIVAITIAVKPLILLTMCFLWVVCPSTITVMKDVTETYLVWR